MLRHGQHYEFCHIESCVKIMLKVRLSCNQLQFFYTLSLSIHISLLVFKKSFNILQNGALVTMVLFLFVCLFLTHPVERDLNRTYLSHSLAMSPHFHSKRCTIACRLYAVLGSHWAATAPKSKNKSHNFMMTIRNTTEAENSSESPN